MPHKEGHFISADDIKKADAAKKAAEAGSNAGAGQRGLHGSGDLNPQARSLVPREFTSDSTLDDFLRSGALQSRTFIILDN